MYYANWVILSSLSHLTAFKWEVFKLIIAWVVPLSNESINSGCRSLSFLRKQTKILKTRANWSFLIVVHVLCLFSIGSINIANHSTEIFLLHFLGSEEECFLSLAFSARMWQQEEGGGDIKTSSMTASCRRNSFGQMSEWRISGQEGNFYVREYVVNHSKIGRRRSI